MPEQIPPTSNMNRKPVTHEVVVLEWSDGSRNLFFTGDFEMEDFILWKQSKYPDLSYDVRVMPLDQYKIQYS
jgi:hypothetical protein